MRSDTEVLGNSRHFPSTHWPLLRPAPNPEPLDRFARLYWKPLYFYVRRQGFNVETSKDIVQEFLAMLIARNTISKADPRLGRFRTFIQAALSNFIKDWLRAATRLKRGGGHAPFPIASDSAEAEYAREIASREDDPETVLNRAWARSLLEHSLEELKGAPSHLAAFRLYLAGECYESISEKTGLSQTAAKVAVHRLRGRLREILIQQVARTVGSEADLNAELSEFVDLLS